MDFQELDLHPALKKAIAKLGYTTPTPIQEKALPLIQEGKDLLASAQTGTGKTAAFLLPILNKLAAPSSKPPHDPKVLILVPTRELALQVSAEAEKYCNFLPHIKIVTIFGGVPYPVQKRQLSRPYEILVATPGRLLDHIERGKISLGKIETFILDEADRMLDMGFIDDVERIAETIPTTRQTLLFSATLSRNILKLSRNLLNDPVEVEISPKESKHENIEQKIHDVDDLHHKHRLLEHLLTDETLNQAIVFTSTKSYADQLVDDLLDNGHDAAALHGDMNQRKRTKTITQMKNGRIRILVATDVAARGIDVPAVSHVINFDLPRTAEEYVHRIGRTGRAGAQGIAFSFVSNKDRSLIREIERYTGQSLKPTVIEGYESKAKNDYNRQSRPGSNRRSNSRNDGPRRNSRDDRPRSFRSSEGSDRPRREDSGRDSRNFRSSEGSDRPRQERAPRSERSDDSRSPRREGSGNTRAAPRFERAEGSNRPRREDSGRDSRGPRQESSGNSRTAPKFEGSRGPRGPRQEREESRPYKKTGLFKKRNPPRS